MDRWQKAYLEVAKSVVYGYFSTVSHEVVVDAMLEAVYVNDPNFILKLLELGADVNAKDILHDTVLTKAVKLNRSTIVRILLDFNVSADNYVEATRIAFLYDNAKIAQMLLDANPDINSVDNQGYSIMHYAVQYGMFEIVKRFIESGIDINAEDHLAQACFNNNAKIVKFLLEIGAKTNIYDRNEGYSPMTASIYFKNYKCAQILLDFGDNPDIADGWGRIPLLLAAGEGLSSGIALLLNNGANINIQNKRGDTALFYAASYDNYYVTEMLLEMGADINIRNFNGHSPLLSANYYSKIEIIKLLLRYGAKVDANDKGFPVKFIRYEDIGEENDSDDEYSCTDDSEDESVDNLNIHPHRELTHRELESIVPCNRFNQIPDIVIEIKLEFNGMYLIYKTNDNDVFDQVIESVANFLNVEKYNVSLERDGEVFWHDGLVKSFVKNEKRVQIRLNEKNLIDWDHAFVYHSIDPYLFTIDSNDVRNFSMLNDISNYTFPELSNDDWYLYSKHKKDESWFIVYHWKNHKEITDNIIMINAENYKNFKVVFQIGNRTCTAAYYDTYSYVKTNEILSYTYKNWSFGVWLGNVKVTPEKVIELINTHINKHPAIKIAS